MIFKILSLAVLALSHSIGAQELPPFGRQMRSEFLFYSDYVSLNHGAYGTYPKHVQSALHAWQERSEANADLWLRRDAKIELQKVRATLAALVGVPDANDIVMVPNATSGMNAILRSMIFAMGERILHFSTIYNSMYSIIQYLSDMSGGAVSHLQFNVTYPISNDQLLENLEKFLDDNMDPERPIRLALIDHITSTPGVVVPIERIIPMLKQRNISVLIDGAHAVGQVPINISQLAPDYYITNCHKWLYAARGCSMMYVRKELQPTVRPAHIASGYGSAFQDEFFWTGTMDYCPYMTVMAALEFREAAGGEEVIRNYTHSLAVQGGQYLADRFGTNVLQDEDQIGAIVDVRLPLGNPDDSILTADFWIDTLLYRFNFFAAPYYHGGQWWIRVSAQIYNDLDDFERAAQTFLQICNEVNTNSTVDPRP